MISKNRMSEYPTQEDLRKIVNKIPYSKSRKVFIVLCLGLIGSVMLFLYSRLPPDGYSALGNTLPIIFNYFGFLKYLVIPIPLEIAFKYYYEKNYYCKYCSHSKYKSRPLILIRIILKIMEGAVALIRKVFKLKQYLFNITFNRKIKNTQ